MVICLWGVGEVSLNTLWHWLGKALGAALITQVRKCLAVAQQSNGQRRFDIYVAKYSANTVLQRLLAAKPQYKWHCRLHLQPGAGVRAPIVARKNVMVAPKTTGPMTVASWNINGLRAKRVELDVFLMKKQPAIIAIQETHRADGSWRLTLPGYSVIERMANRAENAQGVLLAARSELSLIEVEDASQYWVFGQVLCKQQRLVVGSIYLPSKNRRSIKEELRQTLGKILAKYQSAGIVMMGDFNMSADKVNRMLIRWGMPLQVQQTKGSGNTWHQSNKTPTAIDHIVVSHSVKELLSRASVDRSWDVSDHWPVVASMNVQSQTVQPMQVKESFSRADLKAKAVQFGNSTYWEPLRHMAQDPKSAANELSAAFETASWAAAREVGAVVKRKTGPKAIRFHSLRGCLSAIEHRRLVYKKLRAAKDVAEVAQLRTEYAEAKSEATKSIKEAKQWQWLQYVSKASRLAVDGRAKDLWVWIQQFTGRGKGARTASVQPVRHKQSGKLLIKPVDIGNEWAAHYAKLAADETGHSRSMEHWTTMEKPEALSNLRMDKSINREEVIKAITNMANGTAPGSDGIPPELLKAAIVKDDEGNMQVTQLGSTLHAMCAKLYATGQVPAGWSTSAVVSIPKKGSDMTCLDSYRGISLMPVALKLLVSIVTSRISAALEGSGRLNKAQAGFRPLEECVAQAAALLEVLQRRRQAGKPTYLAFIDFKKAYDTVPHEALFLKLTRIGICGRALQFIKQLYANTQIVVQGAFGKAPAVQLLRGLRQGCPMSPILFDVYINDILDETSGLGVKVSGVEDRLAGLLFADDLVLTAPTSAKLHKLLKCTETWATTWEMSFGVKKCAIMGVDVSMEDLHQAGPWVLQGEQVELCEEYTYLGTKITPSLSLSVMAEDRAVKGTKALAAVEPFLGYQTVPLHFRLMALRAVVLPVFTFGAELWGMHEQRAHDAQMKVNQAVRRLFGSKATSTVIPTGTAQLELNLPPVAAVTAGLRARAFKKYPSLKTWIAHLVRSSAATKGRSTWVKGTACWLKTYGPDEVQTNSGSSVPSGFHAVKHVVWERKRKADTSAAMEAYLNNNLVATRAYLVKSGPVYPKLAKGFTLLARARIGAMMTMTRFCKFRLASGAQWSSQCPCCLAAVPETVAHILCSCPKWKKERAEHLAGLMQQARSLLNRMDVAASEDNVTSLLLGGEVEGKRLKNWVKFKLPFSKALGLSDAVGSQSSVSGSACMAQFLQLVWVQRYPIVQRVLRTMPPRANASHG